MPSASDCAAAVVAMCCAFGAVAAESEAPPTVIGSSTESILKMQREGTAAGKAQPVVGEVASRSYKRYLESFNHPIPENRPADSTPARSSTTVSR